MRVETILNKVHPIKGFVYRKISLVRDRVRRQWKLDVHLRERRGSRPTCSICGCKGTQYDRLPARCFDFIPLWGISVVLVYALRRVSCRQCGVKVERVPWCDGKNHLCLAYRWFLSSWAKRLSWLEVSRVFGTSWDTVYRAVQHAVEWGLAHRDLSGITAIGVDEIAYRKGQQYMTLLYQIDEGCKRLLWIGKDRQEKTLEGFFAWFGPERSALLEFVVSDMWAPYLKVIRKYASQAVHILDRFHVMMHFNKAIDQVRAEEARRLKQAGKEPVLRKTRWVLLKRPENLSEKQEVRLAELLGYNLRTVRAYLLRETFQPFWEYVSPYWAGVFMDRWCKRAMRSRIEPMKKIARMLRKHRPLLMNWFRAKGAFSAGVVEGLNAKVKLATRKAYGFRTQKALELALYHNLGNLPEPKHTHKFC